MEVGLDFWDATYSAREVVVSKKYYKAWGKKGLSYVMLNDNFSGVCLFTPCLLCNISNAISYTLC